MAWLTTQRQLRLRICGCCARRFSSLCVTITAWGSRSTVGTDTRWLTPRLVGLPCPITARALPQTSRFPGIANADLAQWIADNCDFRQLILEFYTPGIPDSGWVHVSYDPNDLKKQVMTATKQDGKTVYLTGLVA
jgi:hypothetical protein